VARVLIVEPSSEVRALLAHVVSDLGHEPIPAQEPTAAEIASADVSLVEPASPQALATAQELRERRPDLPLVCVSIHPKTPEVTALKPDAYLVKPFSLGQVERAVETAAAAHGRRL
jgi:CheY-like chemotaxis protein